MRKSVVFQWFVMICLVGSLIAFVKISRSYAANLAKLQAENEVLCSTLDTAEAAKFDTSYIETRFGECYSGKVRPMIARRHGTNELGGVILADESGNLWDVGLSNVNYGDYVLIWISDNGTPDLIVDDEVVQIWIEADETVE